MRSNVIRWITAALAVAFIGGAAAGEESPATFPKSDAGLFPGDWRNEDTLTRCVTRIYIELDQDTAYFKMWASCHPADCCWGAQLLPASQVTDSTAVLKWDHGFCTRDQRLRLEADGRLRLREHGHYTDSSGRQDYDHVHYFVRKR